MKKFLSFMLSVLMLVSCMSFTISAQEAELAALDPVQIRMNNTGPGDQRCTRNDNAKDMLGRTVQQIIPNATSKPTAGMAPAWFSENAAQKNPGYRAVKVVYYVSGTTKNVPSMSLFAMEYSAEKEKDVMVGKGSVNAVDGKVPTANAWNTSVFSIDTKLGADQYLYALMFSPYGSEAVQNLVGETVYIGYMGLFESVEAAQSHVSDFEGDIVLSSINVGGTAISGFNAATTAYTVDLAGSEEVP